jgi:hypothetical protein
MLRHATHMCTLIIPRLNAERTQACAMHVSTAHSACKQLLSNEHKHMETATVADAHEHEHDLLASNEARLSEEGDGVVSTLADTVVVSMAACVSLGV